MNIQDFEKLKDRVDKLKQKLQRTKGSRDTLAARLKSEFGCSSLKDAKTKLAELKREVTTLKQEKEQKLSDFAEQWESKLEELDA